MTEILREKYALGLQTLGYHRLDLNTQRYWIFQKYGMPFIFLGKAGAVRMGRSKRVDLSFPARPDFKKSLLKRGEAKLAEQLPLR